MRRHAPDSRRRPERARALRLLPALALAVALAGCGGQVDLHGHVFTDVDLQQIQPGMSKDQVKFALGSPNTTATVGSDVFYYVSSKRRTRPFMKGEIIDRKILAVYFDQNDTVKQLSQYGLKDGKVFDFIRGTTPSQGKELSLLRQLFGNFANRANPMGGAIGAPPR